MPLTARLASGTDGISLRFWFEQNNGTRLYPYRLVNRSTGKAMFRVARPGAGANRNINQIELDDVEQVFHHVFVLGYSVRLRALDLKINGLYSPHGRSIRRTSES